MHPRLRILLWLVAGSQAALAAAFVAGIGPVTDLVPFAGRTPLTNTFIGSIVAAAAASTAWVLVARSERGLAGIALDYVTILAPTALFSFGQIPAAGDAAPRFAAFGAAAAIGAVVGIALLRWSLRRPWRDDRPLPRSVGISFGVFVGSLVVVAVALIAGVPNILPWKVTPELAVVIGLMFVGASTYFLYGLIDRRWENAGGQLAGFLAYDLVLAIPFLARLPTIDDALRPSLIVYLAVLAWSGALAAYHLAVNPATRGLR